jgi:hypothetical protein
LNSSKAGAVSRAAPLYGTCCDERHGVSSADGGAA